jgi:hypothetical protein
VRVDLGERPTFEPVSIPKAAVWVSNGTEEDVTRAESFAESFGQGARVFTFHDGEDPIAASKAAILAVV